MNQINSIKPSIFHRLSENLLRTYGLYEVSEEEEKQGKKSSNQDHVGINCQRKIGYIHYDDLRRSGVTLLTHDTNTMRMIPTNALPHCGIGVSNVQQHNEPGPGRHFYPPWIWVQSRSLQHLHKMYVRYNSVELHHHKVLCALEELDTCCSNLVQIGVTHEFIWINKTLSSKNEWPVVHYSSGIGGYNYYVVTRTSIGLSSDLGAYIQYQPPPLHRVSFDLVGDEPSSELDHSGLLQMILDGIQIIKRSLCSTHEILAICVVNGTSHHPLIRGGLYTRDSVGCSQASLRQLNLVVNDIGLRFSPRVTIPVRNFPSTSFFSLDQGDCDGLILASH